MIILVILIYQTLTLVPFWREIGYFLFYSTHLLVCDAELSYEFLKVFELFAQL